MILYCERCGEKGEEGNTKWCPKCDSWLCGRCYGEMEEDICYDCWKEQEMAKG